VTPGRYAVVATDWNGELPDPRPSADHRAALGVPLGDLPAVVEYDGLDALVLPMGSDDGGCPGRSIAVGDQSLVCFGHVAIVALAGAERRSYLYASHLEAVAAVEADEGARVDCRGRSYEVVGFGRGFDFLDPHTPGAFSIEAETFDMADEAMAEAFGYGSEAFVAALDEHGFRLDVAAMRARLASRADPDAVMALNRLPSCDGVIAYYAPVAP
jgi:hypothetical protein